MTKTECDSMAGSLETRLSRLADPMTALLAKAIGFKSVSGEEGPFTQALAQHALEMGFEVDLWQGNESDAPGLGVPIGRHLPLAGRPTLVITLRGSGGGPSLMFNAHSDVVPANETDWSVPPWDATVREGRMYGRGACDTKGPLIAALWAMAALKNGSKQIAGDILLEVIPGEEDCVGLGTLTSVARGHCADGVIVLEPTQNLPRRSSRGGCRFELTAIGRAIHGTSKWLGVDAIGIMRGVLEACEAVEAGLQRGGDPLYSSYPIARPVTVDSVRGAGWQGMICDRCVAAGYLELLPTDDVASLKREFVERLGSELERRGIAKTAVDVRFTEEYTGHLTDEQEDLCEVARQVIEAASATRRTIPAWEGWSGFNSGCEAGVRWSLRHTPTLVWGPGDLSHAHAPDESIGLQEVYTGAALFCEFAVRWCASRRIP